MRMLVIIRMENNKIIEVKEKQEYQIIVQWDIFFLMQNYFRNFKKYFSFNGQNLMNFILHQYMIML